MFKNINFSCYPMINSNNNEIFGYLCDTHPKKNIEKFEDTKETLLNKLKQIHDKLNIKYGTFNDELPEQLIALKYLTGNEKVLEIGGNIGRNSLLIGYILNQNNNNNLVTLESDGNVAKKLIENRDLNKLDFKVEASALSNKKMIQKKGNADLGGSTIESDIVLEGYVSVNTINFKQLMEKYNINFDTLVLDCEGAFYYILMDMPEILNNIKLILVENDYLDVNHKKYVDKVLIDNNFTRIYKESCNCWGDELYPDNFYEVWAKK